MTDELSASMKLRVEPKPDLSPAALWEIRKQGVRLVQRSTFIALIDEIEALRARAEAAEKERDDAREWESRYVHEIQRAYTALGEQFTLAPPDGGDVKLHEAAASAIAALTAAEARLRELVRAMNEARAVANVLAVADTSKWNAKPVLQLEFQRIDTLLSTALASMEGKS